MSHATYSRVGRLVSSPRLITPGSMRDGDQLIGWAMAAVSHLLAGAG